MPTNRPKRARRCQLAVPGSNAKMIAKAAASGADHVFLDLEDAVAPNAKHEARKTVIEGLNTLDWGKKVRCVRVNDATTEWCHDDIIQVVEGAASNLDTIMLTKVRNAQDVLFADMLLEQLEKKLGLPHQSIGLELLIEEAVGMMNVDEIACATPRLECMVFGMGDYSASHGIDARYMGGESPYPGDIWHYARFKITVAARTNGIDVVDGPFPNIQDMDGYRREAERACVLGMDGKWAIHPLQIEFAQAQFSPNPDEIAKAIRLTQAYEEAKARGEGAVLLDGVMIDAASVRMVQQAIVKARLYGMM
jgi:citrate lyase subunit beta/citryl-CoA lyase